MIDAKGRPQQMPLLGGTSDIGLALVEWLLDGRAGKVVLAGRDEERLNWAVDRVRACGHELTSLQLEATDVTDIPRSSPSRTSRLKRCADSAPHRLHPGVLRWVMMVQRLLPRGVFRRPAGWPSAKL